ncbi:phosphatases II [Paramyrothecium foliicola]|nr:phosphatases II [Paramyrothecium foliicola]
MHASAIFLSATTAAAAVLVRQDPHVGNFRLFGAAGCLDKNQGVWTVTQSGVTADCNDFRGNVVKSLTNNFIVEGYTLYAFTDNACNEGRTPVPAGACTDGDWNVAMVFEILSSPDPPVSEVESGLFVGDIASSLSADTLESNKITAIVSLADHPAPEWSSSDIRALVPADRHLFVHCHDSSTQDLLARLPEICDFIESMRHNSSGSVLVHCTRGVSRSPAIVAAYLMRKHRQSADRAIAAIERVRRVRPSPNFLAQLYVWDEVQYDCWEEANRAIPKLPYLKYMKKRAETLQAEGSSAAMDAPIAGL